jgi:multidrug efflux pump subunit AcrA (membrane-fusion protein)
VTGTQARIARKGSPDFAGKTFIARSNPMHQLAVDHPASDLSAVVPRQHEDQSQSAETAEVRRRRGVLAQLGRQVPTLVVMALLAGLGAYGHYSDWQLPKFSALTGNAAGRADDWCQQHGVPASQCVECHPQLLPRGKDCGWCREHGVHNCPLCHPEVAQLKQAPVVTAADRARAARALAMAPRQENNGICKNYRRRVQFATSEAMHKAGVEVALVQRQPISESIPANGEITYDQTHFASLSSRLPGTVWRVEKSVGQWVHAGEVLALVDAAEVGRAKTELIQVLAQEELQRKVVGRLDALSSEGIVAGRQAQTAQTEYVQAQARLLSAEQALVNLGLPVSIEQLRGLPGEKLARSLRLLGLPEPLVEHLDPDETTANLFPLKAPADGIVVARDVVAGEVVDAAQVLFQLADTRRMWLQLAVPQEEANQLAVGQPVRFRPDGSRDELSGKLIWISTAADQQTRMVAARVELPNPNGQLRNETFGSGRIILREEQEAIVVSNEAIHWEGCCHVVFVRDKGYFDSQDSPKVFHIRTVRLGARGEKFTEIIAGVLPGEVVATAGSDVLRAELLKNNLGEGCCAK